MTSQAAKNITHLVDNYRQAVEEDYSDGLGGTPSPGTLATRAALEAAIAAAIQPVEPPTDAEVEAWEKQAKRVLHWPDENRDHPDAVFVVSIRTLADGLALMRRARATGSLERLRELVQKEADNACEDYSAGLWRAVELIDEERGAGR